MITTHCALRLGDNFAALHFLRAMAKKYPEETFVHWAHAEYLQQLAPMAIDLPNLQLTALQEGPSKWTAKPILRSIDTWKNADGYWENHPLKWDYGPFMVQFYYWLAAQMGLDCPIKTTRDLLFDYPALKPAKMPCEPFDFLIINSAPQSNQLPAYSADQFEEIIRMLAINYRVMTTQKCGLRVTCTADYGLDCTQIGHLSQACHSIIMVATGPSWPTFNIWNRESVKNRIILSGFETVNLAPHTIHTNKIHAVRDILIARGFL
jgi:hypothetical protein